MNCCPDIRMRWRLRARAHQWRAGDSGALGIWGAVGYFWFTARLFGALRSALSQVLDFGTQRGVVAGKLFDFRLTLVATFLITGYLALTRLHRHRDVARRAFLVNLGLRSES